MENIQFEQVAGLLNTPARILITTHSNPDGDAIGSSLALAHYLRRRGHTADVLIPDRFPEFLSWMEGCRDILIWSENQEQCIRAIENAGIIIASDYNQLSRLNAATEPVKQSQAVKVLIDHHLNPSAEFDFVISRSAISSTSELVYWFIEANGDLGLLDKAMAECIYAGIVTDTGSLSYACNYVKTYEILAHLFRLGIDGEHIHRLIYDTYSESRLRLLGYSIGEALEVLPDLHTAYIVLSKDDLARFGYRIGDTEGIVNYALSIEGINLAALFMERDGIVKLSLRSKGKFPVNELASVHFDGGGHRNAAGANCTTSLTGTVERFRRILPEYRERLKEVY